MNLKEYQVAVIFMNIYDEKTYGTRVKLRLHTAINRNDFVSWWMWFNRLTTKLQRHFLTECILLPLYVYNMHQDTNSEENSEGSD